MTDYTEDQNNEIEALESIYPEELNITSTHPFHSFQISIHGEYDNNFDTHEEASCTAEFSYTATYPDTAPVMEITAYEGINESQVTQLLELMKETAEENLGMASVFAIVTALQERLNEMAEETAVHRQEEEEQKLKEIEAAEAKRLEGTRVTIESFLAWKAKFDAEMAELRQQKGEKNKDANKLTGKELFLSGQTKSDSDVQFLDKEDVNITVDESLFQDMDDLELDEDFDLDDES